MAGIQALAVRGPVRGVTGYANYTRAFVRELARAGVALEVSELEGWVRPEEPEADPEPVPAAHEGEVRSPLVLHCGMPPQVQPVPGRVNVNFTMFEASTIPDRWVGAAERADHVVVPTAACRAAWVRSGVPAAKLHVCPLGVDPRRFDGTAAPLALALPDGEPIADRRVRFLNVGEARPRKNQIGLVRAWLRATRPDDDAVLVLRPGFFYRTDRACFRLDLEGSLSRAGLSLGDGAPILVLEEPVADPDMPSLYTAATHYVSASCGEGWDLPMMEAGASGLSLVAPRHTSYLDYLDEATARLVDAPEAPCVLRGTLSWKEHLFRGLAWWPPDEDDLAGAIRGVLDGEGPDRTGAAERFRTDFTWERAAARLADVLGGILEGGGS